MLGGGILGILVALSVVFGSQDGLFWSQMPENRLTFGYGLVLLSMFCSCILHIIIDDVPANTASVLWQLPQYALALMADFVVVVSSLEYVYEGKAHWPRTGTCTLFFAMQGLGVLVGTLFSLALSKGGNLGWVSDILLTPAVAMIALVIDRCL